jgi:hypothetical protein
VAVLAGPDDDFSDEEEAFVPPPVEKESRGKRQKVNLTCILRFSLRSVWQNELYCCMID